MVQHAPVENAGSPGFTRARLVWAAGRTRSVPWPARVLLIALAIALAIVLLVVAIPIALVLLAWSLARRLLARARARISGVRPDGRQNVRVVER